MKGVKDFAPKVQIGKYLFCFNEADEQEYWYRFKEGDTASYVMFVNVIDTEGVVIASYQRDWLGPVGPATLQTFVDRFTQDAKFRLQFQRSGDPIPDELPKPDTLIHPQCAKAINRINSAKPGKLKFKDFAALKTYGMDKVSRMKLDVLRDSVSKSEIQEIEASVGPADVIKVLRWVKRGLFVNHAIHKIKVDKEIAANIEY